MKKLTSSIRSSTPRKLRRLIQRTGEFFGRGLDRPTERFPSIEGALATLHRLGFNPAFCIDVGAFKGEWAAGFLTEFPCCHVQMIEAQPSKLENLQKLAAERPELLSVELALLGPTDGVTVEFSEMESGSSVFSEVSHFPRKLTSRVTTRLDTLLAGDGSRTVDFLKLDVQGYEIEVLKGAPRALGQAKAVLLEVSFLQVNKGCPLFAEVITFMDRAGFRAFDFFSQIRRRDGVLWATDILFIHHDAAFQPTNVLNADNWF